MIRTCSTLRLRACRESHVPSVGRIHECYSQIIVMSRVRSLLQGDVGLHVWGCAPLEESTIHPYTDT